jgi:hypothetical protein
MNRSFDLSRILLNETRMCLDNSAFIVYILYRGYRTRNMQRVVDELIDTHPLKQELIQCLNSSEPFNSMIDLCDQYLDRGNKSLEYHERIV